MFDTERIKNEIVEWIRAFFDKTGKGCKPTVVSSMPA